MILFDEKMEMPFPEEEPSPPRTLPTCAPLTSFKPPKGLLHHYLKMHERDVKVSAKLCTDPTCEEGLSAPPPPYSPSNGSSPRSSCDKKPFYMIDDSPSKLSEAEATVLPVSPVAGPSTERRAATYRQDGNLDGTWVMASPQASSNVAPSTSTPSSNRSHSGNQIEVDCECLRLESLRGTVRGKVVIDGHHTQDRSRRRLEASAHSGCVDLTLSRDRAIQSPVHVVLTAEKGDVTLRLSSFTGVVRFRSRPTATATLKASVGTITLISSSKSLDGDGLRTNEYFVGDLRAEAYFKGMADDEWTGDILDVKASDGNISFLPDDPSSSSTTHPRVPFFRKWFIDTFLIGR